MMKTEMSLSLGDRGQSVSLGDRGQSEDRRGGAALSGSGSQLLSQLSDLLHQISLAAVQLGPTSVQGKDGGGAL